MVAISVFCFSKVSMSDCNSFIFWSTIFNLLLFSVALASNSFWNSSMSKSSCFFSSSPLSILKLICPHSLPYTCLLYTSPSPRDLSTSRMPSSACKKKKKK
eukprot:TRINITY_DN15843_c0_g1_i4.p1 TRINITY_DN15843_c0_g1~~TRINITY_DN15843_c0_g1_i4.p1  ORF type:complete len:101 (-),score=8.13 TRINITY_DN15843_c0_g1_i4:5-307(-)